MSVMSKPFELKGGHVLALVLGFFATIIGVNVTFIVLAVGSFPGEDVRRSYLQGLQYNQTIAERREQAALGWSAYAAIIGPPDGAQVQLTLTERDGTPLEGATVTGELRRPVDDEFDALLTFEDRGAGLYVASASGLQPGAWLMRAGIARGEQRFDVERRFSWTPQ
jgi:nitrogen fixation protein FixH